jgi:hypothetical protein
MTRQEAFERIEELVTFNGVSRVLRVFDQSGNELTVVDATESDIGWEVHITVEAVKHD